MAHNLMGADQGADAARFIGRKEPGWHHLGEVFADDEQMTATEAIQRVRGDFGVELWPITATRPSGESVALGGKAVMRAPVADDPTWRELAKAGEGYELVTNLELAAMIDPLARDWPVETAGILGKGERMFLTLRGGEVEVAGERIEDFYLVSNSYEPGSAIWIAYTPVRTVCQNTLNSGLDSARIKVAVAHTTGAKERLETCTQLVAQMVGAKEKTIAAMRALAETRVTVEEAQAIVKAAFPARAKASTLQFAEQAGADVEKIGWAAKQAETYRYFLRQSERMQVTSLELYDRVCDEFPAIGGTAWAVYNAVVEATDYAGRWDRHGATLMRSAVFGDRAKAKERAFGAALALAN